MSEELRPCPFCGGEAESTPGRHEQRYARCSMFGCEANNPWIAIEDWNHRPIEDALCAELEQAKKHINNTLATVGAFKAELIKSEKCGFELSASACIFLDGTGLYGSDGGHLRCHKEEDLARKDAEIAALEAYYRLKVMHTSAGGCSMAHQNMLDAQLKAARARLAEVRGKK